MLLPLLWCAGAWAQQYTISTIAGMGQTSGFADGGATNTAEFMSTGGLAVGPSGKLYIADPLNHRVRMLSGGNVTTVAGNGTAGFAGDNGAATSAELDFPSAVAVDSSGNLYIADTGNEVIRKVDTKGNITTIAGTAGQIGATGDSGPATSALLDAPGGIAVDAAGNIYIADTANNEIRKVSGGNMFCVLGCGITGGTISAPQAVAVDAAGNVYIADTGNYRVVQYSGITVTVLAGTGLMGFSGDGGPGPSAMLNNPQGIFLDSAGFVYIADSFNGRIRKILKDGTIVTVAGDGAIAYSGDGGPATSAAMWLPRAVAVDGTGNVYISDTGNYVIRQLTPTFPQISAGGAVNAASSGGKLSPGSLATLYGSYFTTATSSAPAPLPYTLGAVSVTVNGVSAPILFVSPGQINFQVPWGTQTGTATVAVSYAGGGSNTLSVPVVSAAPGLFVSSGSVVAQNYPDYSLNSNSNPIAQGGIIIAYLTGVGPVLPSIADGIATPSTTVYNSNPMCSATLGGTTAVVQFSGLTPGYVGLAQANIQVPSGIASGSNQLIVTCNGQASNSAAIYVK